MPSNTLKLAVARIVMRVVGNLAGLLGVGMLCSTPFQLHLSVTERNPWMIPLAAFPLALGAYFIYVAYLVWFRFSPHAVRHSCGALGFSLLTLTTKLCDPARDSGAACPAFVVLGGLVAVSSAYRVASSRLSRFLFPESKPGVPL